MNWRRRGPWPCRGLCPVGCIEQYSSSSKATRNVQGVLRANSVLSVDGAGCTNELPGLRHLPPPSLPSETTSSNPTPLSHSICEEEKREGEMKSLLSSFLCLSPERQCVFLLPPLLSQPAWNGRDGASASPAEASSGGRQGPSDTGVQCQPGGVTVRRVREAREAQLRASVCLVSKTSFPPVEPARGEQSTAPDTLPREREGRESDIGLRGHRGRPGNPRRALEAPVRCKACSVGRAPLPSGPPKSPRPAPPTRVSPGPSE